MTTSQPPDDRAGRPTPAAGDQADPPAGDQPPAAATPPAAAGPPPPRSRWIPQRRWLVAGAAAVLLLVLGAVIGGIVSHHRSGHRWGHHGGPGHAAFRDEVPGGPDGFFDGPRGPGMGPGGPRGLAGAVMLTGSVVSVDGATLVVAPDGGAPQVSVPTNDRTRFGGTGGGLSGLHPGQRVIVRFGSGGGSGVSPDKSAAAVFTPVARAVGTVTSLVGDRATLVRPDGLTEPIGLAAVNPKPANGDLVAVEGTPADNGATLEVQSLRTLPKAG